mmetsp:Transcript_28656/g.13264  ORF Transcript_28656/g.13264 Transcript_28656/m.13264 type:complete len:106 (+) Transcript_28656:724-1041(+)|eukprot:CAMPEP_0201285912 /NCGR_PEP_ID=MMETSP1317-20130820/114003_1 /ASSEMBLY_ACC=CAM_ASM_000770 /TAXON_ID=187299 /ORGANISM="Undescribed Undescribed, Strain Undescribed" /LENGTH=105 /DNA_ID=CAMNT_0047612101 /DNA_START=692 /DNA_END=1009 /DNA_ORIENTATION=+
MKSPSDLWKCIAKSIEKSMGGSAGVLFSIFFRAGSTGLKNGDFIKGFREGIQAVSLYGGAKEGSRTAMDALIPAGKATNIKGMASLALQGAEATKDMKKATHGRS